MTKDQKTKKHEKAVAVVIILCMMLIAGWEIAAKMAAKPFDELKLKAEDFSGFVPSSDKWTVRLKHTKATPTDPTAIAYELRPSASSCLSQRSPAKLKPTDQRPKTSDQNTNRPTAPLLVRIVHGYNMVDCMRIKQYKVNLISDLRSSASALRDSGVTSRPPASDLRLPAQIWRLTSSSGKVSIWITTMLRTVDFAPTTVDTRDMAFPRIGTPDNPSWAPTGLKWSSLKHPVRNLRNTLNARWNASRCDLPTFLRLRQPAWASDEMLTLVTEYHGSSVDPDHENTVVKYVLSAHLFMMREFQQFREKTADH